MAASPRDPGGPGQPRGSANRGDPVMSRAVVLTMLKLGGLERHVALLEGELKRREHAAGPRRLSGGSARF